MKNLAIKNIVEYNNEIAYILIIGIDGLVLKFGNHVVRVSKDEIDNVKDIDLSDYLLRKLFDVHQLDKNNNPAVWSIKESPNYWIVKTEVSNGKVYAFCKYGNKRIYINSVRELQNLYNTFKEHEEGEMLNEDIDEKILKLYKLI